MTKPSKIIIGNWKMWPETLEEAKKTFNSIRKVADLQKKVLTIICPPQIYVADFARLAGKSKYVYVGAQNVSVETKTSLTGEVNARMYGNLGLGYIIIGHSERRAMGETDEVVNKKIHAVLETQMKAVVCIGEKERDGEGVYYSVIKNQLKLALARVERRRLDSIIIAYEPVWEIGRTNFQAMTAHQIHEASIFIKKCLIEIYGSDVAGAVPVIYGGSVNLENARDILFRGEARGMLIGRTSREAKEFGEILKIANNT